MKKNLHVLVGYPWVEHGTRYNCCAHFYQGQIQAVYKKQFLPSDTTAFGQRYFSPGNEPLCFISMKRKLLLASVKIFGRAFIEQAALQSDMIVSLNVQLST